MPGKSESRPVTAYYRYQSISEFSGSRRLQGPFRVIVFCGVAIFLPCILLVAPLYIRYEMYKDVAYNLGESDLVTVDKPISTFWCSGQDLWMNATFHAYLLDEQPQISEDLQKIEMHKHMQLADDSLEYWGFFLLMGSKVTLSVCSRFDGARLMVVKGTKNLKHCALLDPSPGKDQIDPWEEDVSAQKGEKIEVTFQQGDKEMQQVDNSNPAQQGNSPSMLSTRNKNSKPKLKVVPNNNVEVEVKVDILSPPEDEVPVEGSKSVEVEETSTSGKKPLRTFRVRGKKPKVEVVPVEILAEDQGEETEPDPTAEIKTMHENMKISRHKSRHQSGKPNRTKRFITTQAEDEYYEDPEAAGYAEEDEETQQQGSEDGDTELPPNPVGIEPEDARDDEIHEDDIRSSGSSFAKNLWSCYGGDTLFTQSFSPSPRCQSQDAMMKTAIRIRMSHEIISSGYYYYIFYSDNDIVSNDIFARFNIEKVAYSFPNYTNSCLNATQCSLPLNFFSSEKVLLEVPLQDGVSDEDALAQMVLISTCRPRLGVYFVFPVAILFFILACAFI